MSRPQFTISIVLIATVIACRDDSQSVIVAPPPGAAFGKAPAVSDPTATFYFPVGDESLSLKSDGKYVSGATSVYASGECGVEAKIYATLQASNSGDATLGTANSTSGGRRCALFPRTLTVVYPDNLTESGAAFINVRQIANTQYSMPLDTPTQRTFAINLGSRCEKILFSTVQQGIPVPGSNVLVTRQAANKWRVQTQEAPNNLGYCTKTGESFPMTLDFTIESSYNLPLP